MSATARKLLDSFEKLTPKDRRTVAVEILRRMSDDGLEEELQISAGALFRQLDEEESRDAKRQAPPIVSKSFYPLTIWLLTSPG